MFRTMTSVTTAILLLGSVSAASSRIVDRAIDTGLQQETVAGVQVAQFSSRPAQSDYGRFESFGGY